MVGLWEENPQAIQKKMGVGWVGVFFISECVSKPKTELTFVSSAFLDVILRVAYLSLLWHPAGMIIMMSSLPKGNSLCILYYIYQCLIAMYICLGKFTTGSKYFKMSWILMWVLYLLCSGEVRGPTLKHKICFFCKTYICYVYCFWIKICLFAWEWRKTVSAFLHHMMFWIIKVLWLFGIIIIISRACPLLIKWS